MSRMERWAKVNPKFWECPWYFAKKDLYDALVHSKHFITGKTLDFGCGLKPYEQLFATSGYIGLEYNCENSNENTKADYFYDGHHFPFDDNLFDSAISTQVLEHVNNPQECLNEMARVLKKGGHIIISAPFSFEEHDEPYDFFRFSSYGMIEMFDKAGLEIIEHKKLTPGIRAVISTITHYIHRTKRDGWTKDFICAFYNALGVALSKISKKDGSIYINNFIVARKKLHGTFSCSI